MDAKDGYLVLLVVKNHYVGSIHFNFYLAPGGNSACRRFQGMDYYPVGKS